MQNEINIFLGENITTMVILGTIVIFCLAGTIIYHLVKINNRREEWEQAEKVFQGVFNQVTDSIVVVDKNGIIHKANETFLKYQGKPADKIIGKSIQRIPMDYVFEDEMDQLKKAIAEKGVYERDIKFYHKSGEVIPIHLVFKPLKINSKKGREKTYMVVTGTDLKNTYEKDEYISQQKEELLEIQHLAHLGYWEMNYLTKKIYWSKELYSILGYEEGEVEPNLDIIYWMAYEDDQNRVWKAFLRAFQAQEKVDTHYRIKNNRGEIRDIYLRIRHYFTKENEHLRTIGILQDVTKQVDLREELNAQLIFTDKVLNNSRLLFIEFDSNFEVRNINHVVQQLSGITDDEIENKNLRDVFGNLNRAHRKFVNENLDFRRPLPFRDYKGNIHYIQWDHATFSRRDGKNTNILLGIDVSETIEKRKALEAAFVQDPVTKLPNRYKLEQVLDNYFDKNGKNPDKNLALIFIHVEGIHLVGDAFGQAVEDHLMQSLSERLYGCVGKYGLFVRRYTDQFVLFYPCDTGIKIVMEICQLISKLFDVPFVIEENAFTLKCHIGISKFPDHANTKDDLIRFGSAAMHEAQRLGLDYYFFHDSLEKKLKSKVIGYKQKNN
ncbi:PAS domain S-box protein [Acetobacterium wieringae]|uniref:PAS domain S-box protein n=1 Tax=Acetobacterium wieringae TaxID=52694 RepID=A0A5D0WVH6_9FIRM|nr:MULTISPECIES: PAS domain S-box protein [Acetobacterium]MEA4805198.1 PAS domain S-box protein [Acetobacterium wieringae]TYC88305.1 PAS domain S-box protein [Acetobacterium wieringae]UYO61450.1 PAS domain S-box protein [Acetobacterium wieringae]VUZ28592.1 putative diguanylate cyclase DgcE [Acetobacterium wieringae]